MDKLVERLGKAKAILLIVLGLLPVIGGVCIGLDILIPAVNTGVLVKVIDVVKQLTTTVSGLGSSAILTIIILVMALKK